MHIYHRASDVNLKPIDNIQRIYDVSYSSKHIHKHIILKFAFTLFAHKLFLVPHIQLKVEKVYTFLFQSFIHSFYSILFCQRRRSMRLLIVVILLTVGRLAVCALGA